MTRAGRDGSLPQEPSGSQPIVYVLDRFPVTSETFVAAEIDALRDLGAPVSVITARKPHRYWSLDEALGSEALAWGSFAHLVVAHAWWLWKQPRRYGSYVRGMVRAPRRDAPFMLWAPLAARLVRPSDPRWIHTHFAFRASSFAGALATLLGIGRSVTTHANDLFTQTTSLHRRLAEARVLTISQYNQDYLADRDIVADVNHCGIDLRELEALTAVTSRTYDCAFVGRFVEKKDPLTFVRAVHLAGRALRRPLRAVMVGDGPLRDACTALASELAVDIEFRGEAAHAEALDVIRSSTSLCLPCQVAADGDVDGIPVVLMEAMANGTLVVSTDVSGIPELIRPGTGWLVPVEPVHVGAPSREVAAAVAEALVSCLSLERDASNSVLERARRHVRREFSLESQARGVLAAADAGARSVGAPST